MAAERSKVAVSIPRQAYRGLALLAKHRDKLPVIRECASEATASITELVRLASARTGLPEDDVSDIVDALLGMHGVRSRLNVSAEVLVQALNTCIEQQAPEEWRKENLTAWQAAREALKEAFRSDDPVGIFEKSIRLAVAHQNVLETSRIVTDVRPVFDDAGEKILRAVVTHVLMVEYFDGSDTKRIHLMLDAKDVKELKRICERADKKATVLLEATKALDWPVSVVGEDEHGH